MSGTSLRPGHMVPALKPITASAIPIGRSDTLERNVATILGLDHDHFVKAPPAVAMPAPTAMPATDGRGRVRIAASVACVAVVAAGIVFAWHSPVQAPSPPPSRIAVAGPLPPVAMPVQPRPIPSPVVSAPIVAEAVQVADAPPVTRPVAREGWRKAVPVQPARSHVEPTAAVGQAFTAIAVPDGPGGNAAPAGPDVPVTRLADRAGAGPAALASAAPSAPPTPSAAAPEVDTKPPPAKLRTEALEAIRMLRRQ